MDDNNNIEKFFKDKFRNDNIPAQNWNTPDDSIWENIETELDKKPQRRRILPFFIILSGLLSVGFFYYLYSKQNNQESRLEKLESQLNHHQTYDKGTSAENQINNIDHSNNNGKNKDNENQTLLKKNNFNRKNLKSVIKKIPKNFTQINNSIVGLIPSPTNPFVQNSSSVLSSSTTLKNDKQQSFESETSYFRNSIELDVLDLKLNPITYVIKDLLITKPSVPVTQKPQYLFVGMVSRATNFSDIKSGELNIPLSELLINEKTNSSLDFGLMGSYAISNHFTLNAGLHYQKRSNVSDYLLKVPYTVNTEMTDLQGNFINTFQHSLPSEIGKVETNLSLYRLKGTQITNNELINLEFSYENRFKTLSVPITLSYYLNQTHNGLSFSAGFQNDIVLNKTIESINANSLHTFVKSKSIAVDYQSNQSSDINTSAIFGLGYTLPIHKKLSLFLIGNYGIGLNNIYKSGDFKNRLNQGSISICFMYKIR